MVETQAATPAHLPPPEAVVVVPGAVVDFVVLTGGGVVVGVDVVEGGWNETMQLNISLESSISELLTGEDPDP